MPRIIRCPQCEAEVSCLNYRQDCTEYGDVCIYVEGDHVETDNWDTQEHDNYGDTTYICPECGEDIDSLRDLHIIGDADETASASCAESPTRQPLAGIIPQGNDFRERVEFCTACCELVESAEIQDGKCEMCRSNP